MTRVIRDRLVATPCDAANRYLATGRDQRRTQRELEDAREAAARAERFHTRHCAEVTGRRAEDAARRVRRAVEANRSLNVAHLDAQATAQAQDPGALARVERELAAMWAEYDARHSAYAGA